jgi:hypothetical protein
MESQTIAFVNSLLSHSYASLDILDHSLMIV